MTFPDRVSAYYRTRGRAVPAMKVTGPRCPDCGRRWSREQSEAAFRHVMAGCPERKR